MESTECSTVVALCSFSCVTTQFKFNFPISNKMHRHSWVGFLDSCAPGWAVRPVMLVVAASQSTYTPVSANVLHWWWVNNKEKHMTIVCCLSVTMESEDQAVSAFGSGF